MDVGQPSIEQLRIFLAVAEEGSFNAAAKRLGKAISAVSYAIRNLEAVLDTTLFEREGSRRPELTEAGRALIPDARLVAGDIDGLMARARSLKQGLEAELSIAVDVMVPGEVTAHVLREFQRMFPSVTLRLQVEGLGAIAALVLDGTATFGIAGPDVGTHPDLERQSVGSVALAPVAAPSHPLATLDRIPPGEARKHLQLVLTDRSKLTEGQDFSVFGARTWRLADLGAKHALLREGIGWGSMPLHAIAKDLADGTLVRLPLPESPVFEYGLSAIWRRDCPPGPAACWTLDAFTDRLGDCPAGSEEGGN
ncbi:LysR family transcriptional regulator [Novosphingobium marinum]|uniref:DNA-binding transcriptional LysR family regulator n=1 Tax=Novosphingobium marinum TaxID=1514948 RepID=A0A7Z0BVB4_9SPHN|nr:LysR family transcriptional regulator [Novosphingobium marinum]NYH95165.1 DNA-binding transcriptional LysR family regulator [Novosphingobium marinum]GGC24832.1 LysR family transcriptional regulator [Novosphingobium marinum]